MKSAALKNTSLVMVLLAAGAMGGAGVRVLNARQSRHTHHVPQQPASTYRVSLSERYPS